MVSPSSHHDHRCITIIFFLSILRPILTLPSRPPLSPSPFTCSTDMDCSLNGQCSSVTNTCTCYPGWTGNDCGALDLLPAAQNSGLHIANVSTWGGSVAPLVSSSSSIHLFASTFADCGLTSWTRNSFIAHTVSTNGLEGSFNFAIDNNSTASTAIGIWSHNVVFLNVSSPQNGEQYLIFHIGDGKEGPSYQQTCSSDPSAPFNGTSQCGLLWFSCTPPPLCSDMPTIDGYQCVNYACSGDDEWRYSSTTESLSITTDPTNLHDFVACGTRIMDLHLNCTGPIECGIEAAGACQVTPNCTSFAISDFLNNYTWAMLFSSGVQGLRPNAQWNTWVNASLYNQAQQYRKETGIDMQGESRSWTTKQATLPLSSHHHRSSMFPNLPSSSSSDGSTFPVSFATSLDGPWSTVFVNTTYPTNGNNPAPFIGRNGSVFVVFNDGGMNLFRSDNGWQGPYIHVTSNTCGGGEDPFVWIDNNNNWHCLFHRAPFADPAYQAIGHAYSSDGINWQVSVSPAATSQIQYKTNTSTILNVTFGKRERPHLVFDTNNNPIAFVSAVGINPQCDPFVFDTTVTPSQPYINTTLLDIVNNRTLSPLCDAWVQYQRLDLNPFPAFYDRSWTHVQVLNTN